ncbi:hypothetical protein [Hyperthermus butylicus]|uniref:Uncharacterized protein n=1 Tax=Hyperthermus butylicus (strain DSM 5456 / JCM 9403 / PLM1-5) TaxID=415426 RepID=A2BJU1_HYPBU|nr:hypothetical protein [Hyperthermus butylicus]ABM80252.1 hypothetical protein Hbut_0382 [Hyperthermus butylicus DSM 5456]
MCKVAVMLVLEFQGDELAVRGYFHPAGCMGARYPHLDVDVPRWHLLWLLAAKRGIRLRCRNDRGVLLLEEELTRAAVRVRALSGRVLCGAERVYIMRRRSGGIYIAPVMFEPQAHGLPHGG